MLEIDDSKEVEILENLMYIENKYNDVFAQFMCYEIERLIVDKEQTLQKGVIIIISQNNDIRI